LVLKVKEGGEHMVRELVILLFSVYMIVLIVIADIVEAAKTEGKQKTVILPRGRAYWSRKTKEHKDVILSLFIIWVATIFIVWDPTMALWLLIIPAAITGILVWMSGTRK
jgi:steroid 5-alpha reductase family enzyme